MNQNRTHEETDDLSGYNKILLFDEQVKVYLPEEFTDMDSELAAKKYPYKKRPSVIKIDEAKDICLTLDLYTRQLAADQVINAASSFKKLIRQTYPNNKRIEINQFRTTQGIQGACFSFIIQTGDSCRIIEYFILPIHGRLFFGTLNYPEAGSEILGGHCTNIKELIQEVKVSRAYTVNKRQKGENAG